MDGLAEPNPGLGTYGFLIYQDDKRIAEGEGSAGSDVTNNFAEYTALAEALKKLKQLGISEKVVVRADSKLMVGQMGQGWAVKGGAYVRKLREAKELIRDFEDVGFEWIPREKNQEADFLSRVAYEKFKSLHQDPLRGKREGSEAPSGD